MQVTLFKGLLPVNFPDEWFCDPKKILFAKTSVQNWEAQAIKFPNGKAYLLWVEFEPDQTVRQCHKELLKEEVEKLDWESTPHFVEPRRVVEIFGQSSKVLRLG
jgi:hypothetical protein